jgi:AcrR family transcriptional regulator
VAERTLRADAQRNREAVLRAAQNAFLAHGAEAPLQDIARDAGVGIGTLYRHFPHRDALLIAVFQREIDWLCDNAADLMSQHPPDLALEEWSVLFVRHVASQRGMSAVLTDRVASSADEDLLRELQEVRAQIRDVIDDMLRSAAELGTVREDIDAQDLMRALSGFCLAFAASGTPDQAKRLARLLIDGLRYRAVVSTGP